MDEIDVLKILGEIMNLVPATALPSVGELLAIAALCLTAGGLFANQPSIGEIVLSRSTTLDDAKSIVASTARNLTKAGLLFIVSSIGSLVEATIPESILPHANMDDLIGVFPAFVLGLVFLVVAIHPYGVGLFKK